jgi:hypothetical protein
MVGLREHQSNWVSPQHLFLGLMLLAIGVNFLQFRQIDSRAIHNYRALQDYRAHKSGNIFEIGIARSQSVRYRVGPFYYFGVISPNATVILPSKRLSSWFELQLGLIGFGKAQRVLFRDYDPTTKFEGLSNSPYEVDLSQYTSMNPGMRQDLEQRFSVFRLSPDARTFVVLAPKGHPGRVNPIQFVDLRLLDDSLREALGRDL